MDDKKTRLIASLGLFIGGLLGMSGSFIQSAPVRSIVWGIDGIALIVATALLTLYFFRKGHDVVAAGFLMFVLGEGLILSSLSIDLTKNIPAFGAGVGLWATSLLVISSQKAFPLLIRITGSMAAVLFGIVSFQIFTGESIGPLTKPLPFYAYPVFVITIFGWAWILVKKTSF